MLLTLMRLEELVNFTEEFVEYLKGPRAKHKKVKMAKLKIMRIQ